MCIRDSAPSRSPLAPDGQQASPGSGPDPGSNDDGVLVLKELDLPNADIWFMRFSVDASRRFLAAGNKAGTVYVWDVDNAGDPLAKLAHHKANAAVRQCCFSPDSNFVAYCCDDASFLLFKRTT